MLVSDVITRTYSEWLNPSGINRPSWDTVKTLGVLFGTTEGTFETDGRVANIPSDSIIEIDSELILTSAVSGAAPTVTVSTGERGHGGSTAVAHSGTPRVIVDPKFPRINLLNHLAATIGSLYPAGLYQRIIDSSLTWDTAAVASLPSGTLDVLSLIVRKPGSSEQYTDPLMEGRDYRVLWEFVPAKLRMIRGGSAGGAITLVVKKDFVLPTAEDDDLTVNGIPTTLQSHLPLAVAGYSLQGREVPRVMIEDIRRQLASTGITIGSSLNVGQSLLRLFEKFVGDERKRMFEKDPTRFSMRRSG